MPLFGKGKKGQPEAGMAGSCPECGAYETAVVCQNYEWSYNGKSATLMPTGFRLACQRCPCVFSVNRNGSFRHHKQSLPWTPSPDVMDNLMPATGRPPGEARPTGGLPPPRPPGAVNDPLPFRHPKAR